MSRNLTVPILLYHYVDESVAKLDDLGLAPADFERQLQFFQATGISPIGLDQVIQAVRGDATLPSRPVVLTFDDGYGDNYTAAFPLLRKYGLTGTFFVSSDLVGSPGYMTWEQLSEMAASGMAIESHGATHASLTSISSAELRRELEVSRATIERRLNRPVRYLAYPGGHFNAAVLAAARAADYRAALTTLHGIRVRSRALFELPRVRVRNTDTIPLLAARMATDEAWNYTFERVMRRMGVWKPWKKVRRKVTHSLGIYRRHG